jgi:hypothetical protein
MRNPMMTSKEWFKLLKEDANSFLHYYFSQPIDWSKWTPSVRRDMKSKTDWYKTFLDYIERKKCQDDK